MNRNLNNILPVKKVANLQYRILSPEMIKAVSYLEITDKSGISNGIFKANSPYDLRLGTITNGHNCMTCNANQKNECGHYSYIRLEKPVINTSFLSFIHKTLKCICFKCGNFLIDSVHFPEIKSLNKKKRLKKCVSMIKTKSCNKCGTVNPAMDISEGKIVATEKKTPGDKKRLKKGPIIPPEFILSQFKMLSNEAIKVLGFSPEFSRPEWMILVNVLVIPPTNRPIIQDAKGDKSEDIVYKLYSEIIKSNDALKSSIIKLGHLPTAEDYRHATEFGPQFEKLSFSVSALINDQLTKNSKLMSKNKQIKSIKEILKGKTGWIRGNCTGKRVDFSSRTVIAPESNSAIDTFGIPMYFAKTLTFPVKVSQYNMDYVTKLILAGAEGYPGANSVFINKNGRAAEFSLDKMDLEARKKLIPSLELGSIINRHLIDDDICMFNRQPSLHKYSFMGVRVKINEPNDNVIRVVSYSGKMFNADFDGDECQIHAPRSHTTRAEILNLMLIGKHITSSSNSEIIVSPLQDTVIGPYLIGRGGDELLSRADFMKFQWHARYFDGDRYNKNRKYFKTIEAFESLLPGDFTIKNYGLNIENGKFVGTGTSEVATLDHIDRYVSERMMVPDRHYNDENIERLLDEDLHIVIKREKYSTIVGKNIKEGFIRSLFFRYGSDITSNFLIGMQKVSNMYIAKYGLTCSIKDLQLGADLDKVLKSNIYNAHRAVEILLDEFARSEIVAPITKTLEEYYEMLILERTNIYLAENMRLVTERLKNMPNNNLNNMILSGSKGTLVNIVNIVDNVGQTSINGKRVRRASENRTLPHFPKYDDSYESRGFISNSYVNGLSGTELFMHHIGVRNGLIDTAIKVKATGYATNKLVKTLEDIFITYDNRVCRQSGQIICEQYGGNGFDPKWFVDNNLKLFNMNNDEFFATYA